VLQLVSSQPPIASGWQIKNNGPTELHLSTSLLSYGRRGGETEVTETFQGCLYCELLIHVKEELQRHMFTWDLASSSVPLASWHYRHSFFSFLQNQLSELGQAVRITVSQVRDVFPRALLSLCLWSGHSCNTEKLCVCWGQGVFVMQSVPRVSAKPVSTSRR
jgi:hypothetical protein